MGVRPWMPRAWSWPPALLTCTRTDRTRRIYRAKAMDGVTSALELEVGVGDVERWYAERQGKSLVNFGASVGHIPLRMSLMGDPGAFLPSGPAIHRVASEAEIAELKKRVQQGLELGAVGVGFGMTYTPGASRWEILELFRVAGRLHAPCHVHMRYGGNRGPDNAAGVAALEEVLSDAAITGAPLHVVHINSSGGRALPQLLEMIAEAQAHGLDVTTECYPYTASASAIESALYEEGWQQRTGLDYKDLQWAATGERLTAESFARYRKIGGSVIAHGMSEEMIQMAVASPLAMIASDGRLREGKGHPRSAGTFSRVLGHYVRESKTLTLTEALRKMTIMPARRLEQRVPMMKNRGRIRAGADADLTLFDADQVMDQATYESPALYSKGIRHVLVNGVFVVKDGQLQDGVAPGRPIRAPVRKAE